MSPGLHQPRRVRHPVSVQNQPRRSAVPIDPIFSHQYGWDEALLFVVPIAIAVIVVRRLEKRSKGDEKPPSEDEQGSRPET